MMQHMAPFQSHVLGILQVRGRRPPLYSGACKIEVTQRSDRPAMFIQYRRLFHAFQVEHLQGLVDDLIGLE